MKSAPPRNALYAQSGGVSAVINASACGVIETARKHRRQIGRMYAGRDGIVGVLTENLIDLTGESAATIRALRHTPAGTTVSVSTSRNEAADEVEVIVADDGPGVPPELAPTLFERFVRGAGDRGGSFGLGLAIVRAVAESHGGSVTLQSPFGEPPGGARFTVRLPARTVAGTEASQPAPTVARPA